MTAPQFSIIIPCYNAAPFLPRLIASLCSQTLHECEFIFVNDGSPDNTMEILSDFARQDNRVKIIDKPNEGVSVARNVALDSAQGEFVYILDADDWMEPTWCEDMYRLVNEDGIDILIFNFYKAYEDKKVYVDLGIQEGVYTQTAFLSAIPHFPLAHMLYRRSAISSLRFIPDVRVGEVFTFFVGALARARKVRVTKQCFWNYYHNTTSATQAPNIQVDLTIVKALSSIDAYAAQFPTHLTQYPSFVTSVCRLLNSFAFNKYVKVGASLRTMQVMIDRVYGVQMVRDYLALCAKYTPMTAPRYYYLQGLLHAPRLCYLLLRTLFRLPCLRR